jgi:hypothetical protein
LNYYLFDNNSLWNYYLIPENINNLKLNPTKTNRCLKINAHKYLPNIYNFSIYIDGNIEIIKDINLLLNKLKEKNKNINFFVPIHPDRKCIYEEAKSILKYKKDNKKNVISQIKKIKKDGFPFNYGLSENNILIRNHKDLTLIQLMEKWWEIIKNGSKRDQLSFIYICWKYNFTKYVLIERNLINNYFLIIRKHKQTKSRFIKRKKIEYKKIMNKKIKKKLIKKRDKMNKY